MKTTNKYITNRQAWLYIRRKFRAYVNSKIQCDYTESGLCNAVYQLSMIDDLISEEQYNQMIALIKSYQFEYERTNVAFPEYLFYWPNIDGAKQRIKFINKYCLKLNRK